MLGRYGEVLGNKLNQRESLKQGWEKSQASVHKQELCQALSFAKSLPEGKQPRAGPSAFRWYKT